MLNYVCILYDRLATFVGIYFEPPAIHLGDSRPAVFEGITYIYYTFIKNTNKTK